MFYETHSLSYCLKSKMQMLPIIQTGLTGLMAIGEQTADEFLKTTKSLLLGVSAELFDESRESSDLLWNR